MSSGSRAPEDRRILVFELADSRFAVPLEQVTEVIRAVAPQPLSGAPAIVDGAIVYRGKVVPLLDIRARFHLPAKAVTADDFMIIADLPARTVAIRIDRPGWIEGYDDDALTPGERVTAGLEHLRGVVTLRDGLVLLHDLATFLSDAEAESLDRSMAEASP